MNFWQEKKGLKKTGKKTGKKEKKGKKTGKKTGKKKKKNLAGNNYPYSPRSQGGMKFATQISPLLN